MADFIAVIRRAVTGLPNNTPEMRAKVYEKARAAVRRQLETMTPRPPEEMLQRQLDKLEAAIAEVDSEYTEALPALDDIADEPIVVEPGHAEPVADAEEDDAYVPYAARETEDAGESEAFVEEEHQPAETITADYAAEPAREEPIIEEAVHADHAPAEAEDTDAYAGWVPEADRRLEPTADVSHWPEVEAEEREEPTPTAAPVELEVVSDTARASDHLASSPFDEWERSFPASAPASRAEETDDLISHFHQETTPSEPVVVPADPEPVAMDPEPVAASSRHVEMPPALDLLDWQASTKSGDTAATQPLQPLQDDDFAAWLSPGGSAGAPSTRMNAALDELEFEPAVTDIPSADRGQSGADDLAAGLEKQPYQTFPAQKRRNFAPLLLGLAGLVIVAGGGYAAWTNKDAVSDFVGGLVSSATPEAETDPVATTGDETGADQATAPAVDTPVQPPADGEVAGRKFTQRLLADGTEVDQGDGSVGSGGEGRSVSEQNIPPTTETADASTEAATTAPGASTATTAPPADAAAPVAAGEKAIIYEERVGQPTPTAIPGKIEWSVSRELGASGKPEPEVQGKLTVPENGLTALITFKRNTDNSLPASHLVEIVFSAPTGFEGGAITDVQRVAMKRNEQDRGDPLVAVSAKITDDTFLIALNDFQDVVARNLDLLGSRNWIDIPVTYRNGRRALLTLDKGTTGAAAFESVLKEWAALGTTNGG